MDMKRHIIISLYISRSMGREKQCCNYNDKKIVIKKRSNLAIRIEDSY
jgi:hypothetical protein